MKNKIWKILAAAGSLAVLSSCQSTMSAYAGSEIRTEEYMVCGPEQCRRVLMELASQAVPGKRQEYYLIGEDYEPESLVIAQMFPNIINISNTKIKDDQKNGHRYVTCRIGFECTEQLKEPDDPVTENKNIIGKHWQTDDLWHLQLGDEIYTFRCIDDDYGNNSEYQRCALFLCDTVIRSDVDSSDSKREILTFGGTNNYKTSQVREWLKENLAKSDYELIAVDTGVDSAYLGATVPGTFDEFAENGFFKHELSPQMAEDHVFLLSLEDALEYRNELWNVKGGGSSYSRGYWLRTPAYSTDEKGEFCYGQWGYMVDLDLGCIRPALVSDGSVGLRPAFCLPQG